MTYKAGMRIGITPLIFIPIIGITACAPTSQPVSGTCPHGLPMTTVFQAPHKFDAVVQKASRQNWKNLPIGDRTVRVARELLGTPYKNFTLEVDDTIESPVVNLHAMDCWTYYENALAISRMIKAHEPPYEPKDMLKFVELERYRNGRCDGTYLSRMHHLEEVFADNQRRGLANNITRQLPGAQRMHRNINEMTTQWKSYRYLRANPSLLRPMARIEAKLSKLPIYHIPKSKSRKAEPYLRNGDICAITTKYKYGYTSHVGLIIKRNGRAYFSHATSDNDKGRQVIIDTPITDYLNDNSKHAGMIICRPKDLHAK